MSGVRCGFPGCTGVLPAAHVKTHRRTHIKPVRAAPNAVDLRRPLSSRDKRRLYAGNSKLRRILQRLVPQGVELRLGVQSQSNGVVEVLPCTWAHRSLVRLLAAFVRAALPAFTFSTIRVARVAQLPLQVDPHTTCTSVHAALGSFSGGALYCAAGVRNGRHVEEVVVTDTQAFVQLDGNLPYGTFPSRGDRLSLVYSTDSGCGALDKKTRKLARAAGLPLPPPGQPRSAVYRPRAPRDRVQAADNSFRCALDKHASEPGSRRGGTDVFETLDDVQRS